MKPTEAREIPSIHAVIAGAKSRKLIPDNPTWNMETRNKLVAHAIELNGDEAYGLHAAITRIYIACSLPGDYDLQIVQEQVKKDFPV